MDFKHFKQPIAAQFEKLSKYPAFSMKVDKDLLWQTYLDSFPAGTNPIFRERTEHDCSCCKQFIRAIGDIVSIVDGEIVSIWDITSQEPAYQVVADSMSRLVKSSEIDNIFLHIENKAGTDKNFEQLTGGAVQTWNHFFVNIPAKFVCKGTDIGPKLSDSRADHDVFYRSLTELTTDSVDTVLDLISQGSLYRGDEYKATLTKFRGLQRQFQTLEETQASTADKHNFVWARIAELPTSLTRIRNTSIGTLLIDLSEGLDLDQAVRKFEAVVAPANYKRPTALVTRKMIEDAKKKLGELGLISALERRYATLSDVNINDILFADRSAKKALTGDVFDSLATKTVSALKSLDKIEEVSIEKFISDILPRAETIEIQFENKHVSNLVSLIGPADPTANNMFKWDNRFSWTYNGDMADSIKERVKRAGGSVTGDLLCRLAWFNHDDLDLHMKEPGEYEIYYGNRSQTSPSGGRLDVDMNAGGGQSREPVENIFYANKSKMKEGTYELFVYQYCRRESTNVGFEVELDFMGTLTRFAYEKPLSTSARVTVIKFNYSVSKGIEVIESLPSSSISKEIWGIKTQEFQPVKLMMLSPNFWGDRGIGNKHYFFMLDGCQNDGSARGFYNEFLKDDLTPHRKVIEMVGAKMRTEESVNQLSGLGFSSTQRNEVVAKIKGSFTRTVKIVF